MYVSTLLQRDRCIGAGPAGLSFYRSLEAMMSPFDAASEIGGQFNIAAQIPGKEEFYDACYLNATVYQGQRPEDPRSRVDL